MWGKIIEIIEKSWKEKRQPRRQLAQCVYMLYLSLEHCNNSYQIYKKTPTIDNYGNWFGAIQELINTFDSIKPLLSIYDEAVLISLQSWINPHFAAYRMVNSEGTRILSDGKYLASLNIVIKFDESFENAVQALKNFIKNNFSMEEIFSSKIKTKWKKYFSFKAKAKVSYAKRQGKYRFSSAHSENNGAD